MKTIIFCTILLLAITPAILVNSNSSINLTNTEDLYINNTEITITQAITLKKNSTLIINNSKIIIAPSQSFNITVEDNASLTIHNSTLESREPINIRLKDHSKAEISKSKIQDEKNSSGIGLSDYARLSTQNSKFGYIRLVGNTSLSTNECLIGDLGILSAKKILDQNSTIQNISLYYQNNIITLNNSIHGYPISINEKGLVTEGETYSLNLNQTRIVNPPNIYMEDGLVFFTNVSLGSLNVRGNSGAEITQSDIVSGTIEGYIWITVEESNLDELLCYNGDFNIDIRDTEISQFMTYMTIGLNLKIEDTVIDFFNLMYAHPDAPHNIEIIRVKIANFYIKPGGPDFYQFTNCTVNEKISLELDPTEYKIPTLTGSILFNENVTIHQIPGEGKTSLNRVYKIVAKNENGTLPNTPVSVTRENKTIYNGKTNDNGEVIFTVLFEKEYTVLESPPAGGPYMVNYDDFFEPITITITNQDTSLSFLSDTPRIIEIEINSVQEDIEEEKQELEENPSIPIPLVSLIIGLAIIIALLNKTSQAEYRVISYHE